MPAHVSHSTAHKPSAVPTSNDQPEAGGSKAERPRAASGTAGQATDLERHWIDAINAATD